MPDGNGLSLIADLVEVNLNTGAKSVDTNRVYYIIAGAVGGVIVLGVIVFVAFTLLRKKSSGDERSSRRASRTHSRSTSRQRLPAGNQSAPTIDPTNYGYGGGSMQGAPAYGQPVAYASMPAANQSAGYLQRP